jgi:hypothetical protein
MKDSTVVSFCFATVIGILLGYGLKSVHVGLAASLFSVAIFFSLDNIARKLSALLNHMKVPKE